MQNQVISEQTPPRFIVAGSLIDGTGAEVRRHLFLALEAGIITAIGPLSDLPCKAEAVIDFSHCIILPALVDCSVSLLRSPALDMRMRQGTEEADSATKAAILAQHISYCHMHGVLGMAVNDDLADLAVHWRNVMEQDRLIETRTSGRLCGPGQGCAAGEQAGGDFLRIVYSGSIEGEEKPSPRMSPDALRRFLQQKGGKKAVVVANGPQPVAEALAAGADAIEQGYGMGEENLGKMAANGVLWIPGILRAKNALDGAGCGGEVCCRFSQRYVAPGKPNPGEEGFWKKTFAEQLTQLRQGREMGVATAVGTGAGGTGLLHGESVVEEMKLFIKAGYSLEETIRCATENGARFFGLENLGTLAVGRRATFLIARGSVKQLPRKLSYLEGIYIDGAPSAAYRKNPVKSG
jgi:imidazolonepropionase-like amidohydrolase